MKQEFNENTSQKSYDPTYSMETSYNGSGIEINSASGDYERGYKHVNHKKLLLDDIGNQYNNAEIADFNFIVEKDRIRQDMIPAHKFILGSRSNFLRKIIENTDEYFLDLTNSESLRAILRYLYQAELFLGDYNLETLLEMVELAKTFELHTLVTALTDCIKGEITIKNVWYIYNTGLSHNIDALVVNSLKFMDNHATAILNEETTLKHKTVDNLRMLFERPTFRAPEVEKFKATYNWINNNPYADQGDILSLISLEKLAQEELLETVRPTKLINDSQILDAIDRRKRKRSRLSIDSATNTEEVSIDTSSFAFTPKCAIKTIKHETEPGCFYYLAEFPEEFHINYIKIRLSELIGNKGEFSYYVEVSIDNIEWTRIIDYSKIICRSWQHLHFDTIPVKYIKVIGTKIDGSINDIIIDYFEAKKLINNIPDSQNGYVRPKDDIANLNSGTRIKYPANRHDLFLFNSTQAFACFIPVRSFGSDFKKNAFTIQFAQPYLIDSMEFKIYYKDKDTYRYYVQVSLDEHNWDTIDDKRDEGSRGAQLLRFDPRPVTFIRIVGVGSDGPGAGKFIGCSMFKCPADQNQ